MIEPLTTEQRSYAYLALETSVRAQLLNLLVRELRCGTSLADIAARMESDVARVESLLTGAAVISLRDMADLAYAISGGGFDWVVSLRHTNMDDAIPF